MFNHYSVAKKRSVFNLMCCLVLLCSAGCSSVYKSTGKVITGFTEAELVPYVATLSDLDAGCQTAQSMSAFLLSFQTVAVDVSKLDILMSMLSGHCKTEQTWESELAYLRALHQKNPAAAKDAGIQRTRFAITATQRYWQGYQAFERAFETELEQLNQPLDSTQNRQCPDIAEDDQLYWLIGLVNGLLAVMSDGVAERASQVPLTVANEVATRAPCLTDAGWWGMVSAMQAVVASLQIESNTDWQQLLSDAMAQGSAQGVRLASAFAANVYYLKGDEENLRAVIRRHFLASERASEAGMATRVSPKWAMFDRAASAYVLAMSDFLWTQATGSRTPQDKWGQFWDESTPDQDFELDWDAL